MPSCSKSMLRGLHADAADRRAPRAASADSARAAPRGSRRCRSRTSSAIRAAIVLPTPGNSWSRPPASRSASGARVLDRLGRALVGHELEERLARKLHQRADLLEPPRDLGVRQRLGHDEENIPRLRTSHPMLAASGIVSTRRFSICRSKRCVTGTTPTRISTARAKSSTATATVRACGCKSFSATHSVLCGIDEALAILKLVQRRDDGARWRDGWDQLDVRALYDGDAIGPFETVMTIEGDYDLFAHLETPYLGVLSRRTRIATNARAIVDAADGKDVLFFPARFDHHLVQTGDGYAAYISGALGVSTDANAEWWGSRGMGTVPHALIAAYGGDTVLATQKFAEYIDPTVNVISLVDFDNDCVRHEPRGRARARQPPVGRAPGYARHARRRVGDPADGNVPADRREPAARAQRAQRARRRRLRLREDRRQRRIQRRRAFAAFERERVPVDAYAVGSAFFDGNGQLTITPPTSSRSKNDGALARMPQSGAPRAPQPATRRAFELKR